MSTLRLYLIFYIVAHMPLIDSKTNIKKLTVNSHKIISTNRSTLSPPINIWIHGTRFIRRPLYHNFFNNTPSLRLAQELEDDYYLKKLVKNLSRISPEQFNVETFYLFGWSGKLRSYIREQAAEALYAELGKIISDYKKKYGVYPFIRIITHSHGGTVALNLVKIHERLHKKENLHINELVLLACPVQESTQKYIESDIFDHTISLYSSLDMVQILAPQVLYNVFRTKKGNLRSRMRWPLFSYRRFQKHPKLIQIKIKINGRALFHTEFTRNRFISLLPHILYVLHSWKKHNIVPDTTHLLCVYTKKYQNLNSSRHELVS